MKICPICTAKTFDDAVICFGCMHHFEETQEDGELEERIPIASSNLESSPTQLDSCPFPPAFFIRMVPEHEKSGEVVWSCSIELVETKKAPTPEGACAC